jgi:AraC-like DNA-binding protein
VLHRDGESALAEPTSVVVFGEHDHYRVSHPVDGGDQCLTLRFRADVHEDALGSLQGSLGRRSPKSQLCVSVFARALARGAGDVLAREEAALAVVDDLASDLRREGLQPRVSAAQRRRANQVGALLCDALAARWSLAGVAEVVGCSPFYLARQFRLATGETLSRYLLRLRLAEALRQMAEGESDLARMAINVGFSSHSHFSARFRSMFGCTPARARRALSADEWSTLVTAGPAGST